jgi:elongation factor 2
VGQRVYIKQGGHDGPLTRRCGTSKNISRIQVQLGRDLEEVKYVTAGNMCMIDGIDASLLRTGTITDCETAGCIKGGKLCDRPAMFVTISVRKPADLSKLINGMHKLAQIESIARSCVNAVGEHVLEGIGEQHLESCVNLLRSELLRGVEIDVTEPSVIYCETLTTRSPSIITKSPNKHNVFTCAAEPLEPIVCQSFDSQEVWHGMKNENRNRIIHQKWGWDDDTIKNIWSFGIETERSCHDPNIFSNSVRDVEWLHEIKDSAINGFQWTCGSGPLCDFPVRELKLILQDVRVPTMPIMRGGGQITPTVRRATSACILEASPTLLEPVYGINICCPYRYFDDIETLICARQGTLFRDHRHGHSASNIVHMHGTLPAVESVGFAAALYEATGRTAPLLQMQFDSWRRVSGFEDNPAAYRSDQTPVGRLVKDIRERIGLKVFENSDYYDVMMEPPSFGKGARSGV